MIDFTLWDILRNLLLAARWTVVLSLIAFVGGGAGRAGAAAVARLRAGSAAPSRVVAGYVQLFQGTPLLMQLFLAYFGLALFGIDVSAWIAAARGAHALHQRLPHRDLARLRRLDPQGPVGGVGQPGAELRRAAAPRDRCRRRCSIAMPPTVGFLVQVIKGTALASVIGFVELTKAGTHDHQRHLPALRGLQLRRADVLRAVLPDSACSQDRSKGSLHGGRR